VGLVERFNLCLHLREQLIVCLDEERTDVRGESSILRARMKTPFYPGSNR